ncbi:Blue-light-activated protein [Novipirellula aureliae]|uniref:histidine kinase n=1 Tax=Novipirellula aureliae TaxID=2527966 RepID=A0A5C6DV27_9BACT|nr:ATP-binding protein [Novipirellula aureliae]TWU41223.1 Blue-light-activated protein [Novipirellula aureliae]
MQSIESETNRRILIIDDNLAIHEDFRKILVSDDSGADLKNAETAFFGAAEDTSPKLNVELDSAHQGREGLDKVVAAIANNRPYAVAFVDMRMPPGWDGLTTIEHLRHADPDLQIVICTAYSDNSWSDICRRLGYTDRLLILKKPFDNAEVCQLAIALTEKWNLSRQACLSTVELERLVDERTSQLLLAETSLRQKQKLEAIGSLAGGVAHEFNNLLQIISGYTRFAMDDRPTDRLLHEDLRNVMNAANQATEITGQLLRFSRNESTEKSFQPTNEIVTGTLNLLRPLLESQIEMEVNLGETDANVLANREAISQAILNLCINARDAMPDGGRLTITTEVEEPSDLQTGTAMADDLSFHDGRYSVIAITDTGCGIPTDLADRIFDPFFTTKEVGKGTGLGLAMVFAAAQDHEGAVTVQSIEGKGSTFRIYLPVAVQPSETADCGQYPQALLQAQG